MRARTARIAAIGSTLLLVVSVLLFVLGFSLDPRDHHLSLGPSLHVGLTKGGDFASRVAFFCDGECGPFRGSVVALADSKGNVYPPFKQHRGFGDDGGIYYRYFEWDDYCGTGHLIHWTLTVSLWYPIVLFAVFPVIWGWRQLGHRRKFRRAS
jgi:hypothetical protein